MHDAVERLVEAGGEPVGVVEFEPIDREAGVADLAVRILCRVLRR